MRNFLNIFHGFHEIIKGVIIGFSDGIPGALVLFFDFLNIESNRENRALAAKIILLAFKIIVLFLIIGVICWFFH